MRNTPILKQNIFGFDVEFVPGYYIKKISERKTAVDRTPLHLKYLNDKLTDELKREIIIARQFFNNNLLYGADLKHNGVPGYLLELLILNYGSCQNLSRAIVRWDNKVTIDVKRHYNGNPKFNDSLIVIDPTDSERNVGAAFSKRNFEICKFLFKEFIKNPTIQFFNGNVYENYISQEELNYAIVFEINKEKQKTEDARWGAMKSLSDKIEKKVKECYVSVKKKSVLIGKSVYLIYLFDNDPFIHTGPLITDSENADKFKQKNKNTYIEDNRLKVKINLTQKEK
jgi:tRNA nucleotidyltransferase (CCA-adding enzyme)